MNNNRHFSLIFILYTLCALSFSLAKMALLFSKPIFFVGFRMVIAGFLLLSYCFLFQRKLCKSVRYTDIPLFCSVIAFHIYGAYVLDLISLQYVDSFLSALFFNLSPFFTALFSYIFLQQTLTRRQWLGLCIGFGGLWLPMQERVGSLSSLVSALYWPELCLIGAVICSTLGWVFVKELIDKGYSYLMINGVAMLAGGIGALATSYLGHEWDGGGLVTNWASFMVVTIAIIIVSNILFYSLYSYLLTIYTPTFLSFAGFLCPFIVGILGYMFLQESPTYGFWLSCVIVSAGLYLYYKDDFKK